MAWVFTCLLNRHHRCPLDGSQNSVSSIAALPGLVENVAKSPVVQAVGSQMLVREKYQVIVEVKWEGKTWGIGQSAGAKLVILSS